MDFHLAEQGKVQIFVLILNNYLLKYIFPYNEGKSIKNLPFFKYCRLFFYDRRESERFRGQYYHRLGLERSRCQHYHWRRPERFSYGSIGQA